MFCLQRECGHYRRRLTRQAGNETGFEAQLQTEDGEIELALAAGMPVSSLQRYPGHEHLDTTMIYAEVSDA